MRSLYFHFDFISPFGYLAWTQIHDLAARHDVEVRSVPTLFAALLAEGKTRGPAEIPAKRKYFFKDAFRTAHLLGVRFSLPPSHPFNPLLALRVASLPMDEPTRRRLITALYDAAWIDSKGIDTPERVVLALDAAGLPGADLVARAPEAKDILRRATDDAIAHDVFGVPTMRVDGELFWGVDSFGHLERYLDGKDPLQGVDLGLLELPSSAVRTI